MYNTNPAISNPAGGEGISTKLKKCLQTLTESSNMLQKALVSRNPKLIWEILSEQEKIIQELEQYSYLWSQLFNSPDSKDNPTINAFKEMISGDIKDLRRVVNCSSRLSTSYLSAVRKALQHTGTNLANKKGKTNVYGKRGRVNIKKSFIISQEG